MLIVQTIGYLEALAGADSLLAKRNAHIGRAGSLIDGTAWARAQSLEVEAKTITRIWSRLSKTQPDRWTVRGELHAAALIMELPMSGRQFYRILVDAQRD